MHSRKSSVADAEIFNTASEGTDASEDHASDVEQDFHTPASPSSAGEDVASVPDENNIVSAAVPLQRLLPSPAGSFEVTAHAAMAENQKPASQNEGGQTEKAILQRLRAETRGTGTLEAGRMAQIRRGVVPAISVMRKVKSGRVKKQTTKPKLSGRQAMIESRKREIEKKNKVPTGSAKKKKSSTVGSKPSSKKGS